MHSERPEVLANPRADRVRKVAALAGRSARLRAGRILIEGPQSVREVLTHRADCVEDVYLSEKAAQLYPELLQLSREGCRWTHLMTDEVSAVMSENAQGCVAVATSDAIVRRIDAVPPGATLVILAQGRDPGNVGTIIRSADAMGAAAVLSVAGTVEASNPKVIRSSAGSIFHLPVIPCESFAQAVDVVHAYSGRVLGTSGGAGTVSLTHLMHEDSKQSPSVLRGVHAWAFGHEARGLSAPELQLCDELVRIDMTGKAESLNVASAAAMCLFASQTVRTQAL